MRSGRQLANTPMWIASRYLGPMTLLQRLLTLSAFATSTCFGQSADQERAVLQALDRFFHAMTERDTALMASTVVREGDLHIIQAEASSPVRTVSFMDYLARLAQGKERLVERYWDARIQVSGPIATATMPYDFHIDGVLSHCGIDVFTLVNDGVWRIASVSFTRQVEGCPESPLGPLKE